MRLFGRKQKNERPFLAQFAAFDAERSKAIDNARRLALAHPELFDRPLEIQLAPFLSCFAEPPITCDSLEEICGASVERARQLYPEPIFEKIIEAACKSGAAALLMLLQDVTSGVPQFLVDGPEPSAFLLGQAGERPSTRGVQRSLSVIAAHWCRQWAEFEIRPSSGAVDFRPELFASRCASAIDPFGGSFAQWIHKKVADSKSPDAVAPPYLLMALKFAMWVPDVGLLPLDGDPWPLFPVAYRPACMDIGAVLAVTDTLTTVLLADFEPRMRHLLSEP